MSKQKKLPYFPLYPSDFLGDTSRLSAEKFGVYVRLLFNSWIEPLYDDMEELAVATGSEKDTISHVLNRYFELKDGVWVNNRLEKERTKSADKHHKAVERAKNAADARWNATSNATSNAQAMPTQNSEPKAHNTEPKTQKERIAFAPHRIFADINDNKISHYEKGQITKLCQEYTQETVIATIEKMGDAKWHSVKSLKGLLDGSISIERGAKEGAVSTLQ